VGGTGRDVLVGSAQADFFHFTSSIDSGTTAVARDLVTDFEDGWDAIALDRINAKAGTAANDAFTFIGTDMDFRGQAEELRAIHTATGLRVQGDVNGDGRADFAIDIADACYAITLTGANFSL
jgi:Ca2+-binding RTX toxin-like protein